MDWGWGLCGVYVVWSGAIKDFCDTRWFCLVCFGDLRIMADADLKVPYMILVKFDTPIGQLYAYGSPMTCV